MSGSSGEGKRLKALHSIDERALPSLFETVLDRSTTGVMVVDAELRMVYVNDVAARVGGYPADVHVGRRLSDLYPQTGVQAAPLIREVFRTGTPLHNEELVWESPEPPHERRFWMVTYVPVPADGVNQYVAAIYVETTGVRRAHERLAKLIDALPTFVGMCSPDGILLEANEATLAATEQSREDLVGLPLWEASWWSDDDQVQVQLEEMLATAQAGQQARADIVVRRQDGSGVTIDFQLVPIVEHGVVTALVPSGIDITGRVAERDRLEALATLSRHLNGAVTTAHVARLVVAGGPDVVNADFATIAVLDEDRQSLELAQPLKTLGLAERWATVPLDGPRTAAHDVVATGRPVLLGRAERVLRYPDAVRDTDRVGLDSTAAMPLVDERGEVFGVVGFGWVEQMDFAADELRLRLDLVADLCGHALRRAQRTEARDQLVQELQAEVLAMPDASRTLDVALAYEPARGDIGLGGDWYDVIEVGDECTALVVGDVAGHGITAAARMTEAKATIRTLVLNVPHPDVVPNANRSLAHFDSGYIATAAIAWIDTGAGTLEWRLAGHVPPVLRTDDGTRLLSGVHHPPIGTETEPREQQSIPFPAGSLLVLYTDGLVERRDEDIDAGLERLRSLVEQLPPACTATEALDAIMQGVRLAQSEDDVAIVVVRNR